MIAKLVFMLSSFAMLVTGVDKAMRGKNRSMGVRGTHELDGVIFGFLLRLTMVAVTPLAR